MVDDSDCDDAASVPSPRFPTMICLVDSDVACAGICTHHLVVVLSQDVTT